ncbi:MULTISPECIES: DUF2065 domain-containing protein [Thiomicrorhabdus]|uniref:DUF2065 domain-containing protein n=1 Tax=Thiomicrorhabdus heinhorstiae TaxID=2748010 RepID=A0ABS0BV97_9GAMM|nr:MULTISPECIES: DUF2065 domain-containing protein [Thiomicrorhabdus]MBF6056990.1 DUF2065 domain-containing protein [Thiomicrorhabdus heinhorstiae]
MLENTFITAIALVLILEGLLPFAFPRFWRQMMQEAVNLPNGSLRRIGLISIGIGLMILLFFSE